MGGVTGGFNSSHAYFILILVTIFEFVLSAKQVPGAGEGTQTQLLSEFLIDWEITEEKSRRNQSVK